MSDGYIELIYCDGSIVDNLDIANSTPLHINISDNSGVNIKSITISSLQPSIEINHIKLSGNFSNSQITIKSSVFFQCGNEFTINNPIIVTSNSPNNILGLSGDFSNTKGIIIKSPMKIFASNAVPPIGLKINISPYSTDPIYLSGNYLGSDITLENTSSLVCYDSLNSLTVNLSAENSSLKLAENSSINKLIALGKVNLEGESSIVESILNSSIGRTNIFVEGIYQNILFKDGKGTISTRINSPGTYSLTLSVKKGDLDVPLKQKPLVIVR